MIAILLLFQGITVEIPQPTLKMNFYSRKWKASARINAINMKKLLVINYRSWKMKEMTFSIIRSIQAKPIKSKARKITSSNKDESTATSASLEDFVIGKIIGQGAYAVVRIGLHKPTDK